MPSEALVSISVPEQGIEATAPPAPAAAARVAAEGEPLACVVTLTVDHPVVHIKAYTAMARQARCTRELVLGGCEPLWSSAAGLGRLAISAS